MRPEGLAFRAFFVFGRGEEGHMARRKFSVVGNALVWISSRSGVGVRWFAESLAGQLSPPEQALVLAGHDGWRAVLEAAPLPSGVALGHGRAAWSGRVRDAATARRMAFMEVRVEHDIDGYLDGPRPAAAPGVLVRPEWEDEDEAITRTLLALADLGVITPNREEREPS
jgi:hypothetical protein